MQQQLAESIKACYWLEEGGRDLGLEGVWLKNRWQGNNIINCFLSALFTIRYKNTSNLLTLNLQFKLYVRLREVVVCFLNIEIIIPYLRETLWQLIL